MEHSLLASCGEKCAPQPLGFRLSRSANGVRNVTCFVRWQPNRKDNRNTFFGEPGPPHLFLHTKSHFRKRKCLTGLWTFVYKCPVSIFETWSCQQSARTSLARLANQRHPAVTGAGKERLAVNASLQQGDSTCPRIR